MTGKGTESYVFVFLLTYSNKIFQHTLAGSAQDFNALESVHHENFVKM